MLVTTPEPAQLEDLIEIPPSDFVALIAERGAKLVRDFVEFCNDVLAAWANPEDRKALRESLEWTNGTHKTYLRVAEFLADVPSYNLELLDPDTIKLICSEKYKPIIEELKTKRLTIKEVREWTKSINDEKKPEPPKQIEWTKNKHGDRTLNLRVPDGETAIEFERQYKQSELPLVTFIRQLLEGVNHSPSQPENEETTPVVITSDIRSEEPITKKDMSEEEIAIAKLAELSEIAEEKERLEEWLAGMKVEITTGDYEGMTATLVDTFGSAWWVLLDDDNSGVKVHCHKHQMRRLTSPPVETRGILNGCCSVG